ncbi:hypothetical protein M0R45_026410 [Rubus argutus]|uniref:Uncharacterized protein n=1 Tax=Rubus argutus TaxID=59490 RepID=A0AAW1WY25_RUBAR
MFLTSVLPVSLGIGLRSATALKSTAALQLKGRRSLRLLCIRKFLAAFFYLWTEGARAEGAHGVAGQIWAGAGAGMVELDYCGYGFDVGDLVVVIRNGREQPRVWAVMVYEYVGRPRGRQLEDEDELKRSCWIDEAWWLMAKARSQGRLRQNGGKGERAVKNAC